MLEKAAKNCNNKKLEKLPKVAKSYQKLPKHWQELLKIAKSYQKLHCHHHRHHPHHHHDYQAWRVLMLKRNGAESKEQRRDSLRCGKNYDDNVLDHNGDDDNDNEND